MDDRIAGEAAKLATQAQELATSLKGVAQQITAGAVRRPHLRRPGAAQYAIQPAVRRQGDIV